jgi:hypothetical protein
VLHSSALSRPQAKREHATIGGLSADRDYLAAASQNKAQGMFCDIGDRNEQAKASGGDGLVGRGRELLASAMIVRWGSGARSSSAAMPSCERSVRS